MLQNFSSAILLSIKFDQIFLIKINFNQFFKDFGKLHFIYCIYSLSYYNHVTLNLKHFKIQFIFYFLISQSSVPPQFKRA